jgi:uncharacterized DUF497 family protein
MKISYDPVKDAVNIDERGSPFDRVKDFDFSTAIHEADTRQDYGELRIVATGYLDNRLHVLVFTPTAEGIRVISFRKANRREIRNYGQKTAH